MDDFLTIDEACKFLGVSRPTFNLIRKEKSLPEVRLGKRILFNKQDLIAIFQSQPSKRQVPEDVRLLLLSDTSVDSLETATNKYDLSSITQFDPFGALSLLTTILRKVKDGQQVEIVVGDNSACRYLASIDFFLEIDRLCGSSVKYNKEHVAKWPVGSSPEVLMPIKSIRHKGTEKKLIEDLISLLKIQGFVEEVRSFIGNIIGELCDNSMTHSSVSVSERICFITAKRFRISDSDDDCVIIGLADTGTGIYSSLKTNSKYAHLSDRTAFIEAFRPFRSSWPDEHKRGKGLTDVVGIAYGNHGIIRVENNSLALMMNFRRNESDYIREISPMTISHGTRFGLILINSHFEIKGRPHVDALFENYLERH